MDDVIANGRAEEAEQPPRGRVDRGDVVPAVHDDDADRKVEQDAIRPLGGRAGVVSWQKTSRRRLWPLRLSASPVATRSGDGRVAPPHRRRHENPLPLTAEQLEARLLDGEMLREGVCRLRLPQHEVAAGPQREGEEVERAALKLRGEVDEHVAAEHQVDAGKG